MFQIKEPKNPKNISSYFLLRVPLLILVTITGIVYNVGRLANPIFLGRLVDVVALKDSKASSAFLLLGVYLSVILLVQTARALKRYFVRRFAYETIASRRSGIFSALRQKSLPELSKRDIGSLSSKRRGDVAKAVEGRRKVTTEIFDTIVLFLVYIIYLFLFDVRITSFSLLPVFFAVLASFLFRKAIYLTSEKARRDNSLLSQRTYEDCDKALLYRIYGREKENDRSYLQALSSYEKSSRLSQILTDISLPLTQGIALIGLLPLRRMGTDYVRTGKSLPSFALGRSENVWTVGVFTTYLDTFVLLSTKACHTSRLFSSRESGLVSYRRIVPLREETTSFKSSSAYQGHVVLSFSHFSLSGENKVLVKDLNLTLHDGEKVGICGPIASGKSLFFKARRKEADYEGSLTINGKEVRDLSREELASYLVYRGHKPDLFTDSIENNIALGEKKGVRPYLEKVDFLSDLNERKEKEKTIIGNRGIKLSGGQQQRLSLARTLYHQKRIRVLDDPFSRVDLSTEDIILENRKKERESSLVLISSHRLSNFARRDEILLFDGKGNVQVGNEKELRSSQLYQNLKKGDEEK